MDNKNNQEPFNPFNSNANVGLTDNSKAFSAVKFDNNSQQVSQEQQEFQKPTEVKKSFGQTIVNIILVILIIGSIIFAVKYIKNNPIDIDGTTVVKKLDDSYPVGYYNVEEDGEKVAIQYYWNPYSPSDEGYYTVYAHRINVKDDGTYSMEMQNKQIQKVTINNKVHNLVYTAEDGDLEMNITYNDDKTITVEVVKNSLFYELDILNGKTISISETLK